MSILTMARAAALVALFAALPAPASAQFGFIKKQLKQKIVHEVVDSAISKVAGQGDSAQTAAVGSPTTAQPQGDSAASSGIGGFLKKRLGQKLKGAPADSPWSTGNGKAPAGNSPLGAAGDARSATGPQFDQFVVEITPKSLDGLQKFLATQKARKDDPAINPLSALSGNDQLTFVRYSMMAQRVVAYCAANQPGVEAAATSMYGGSAELQKSFTPSELAALRPRCPRLMSIPRAGS